MQRPDLDNGSCRYQLVARLEGRTNHGLGTQASNTRTLRAVNERASAISESTSVPHSVRQKAQFWNPGSASMSRRSGKGFCWLGYVAVNMGAEALVQADHPSRTRERSYSRRISALAEHKGDEHVRLTGQHAVLPEPKLVLQSVHQAVRISCFSLTT
jgi:hypothetical protein